MSEQQVAAAAQAAWAAGVASQQQAKRIAQLEAENDAQRKWMCDIESEKAELLAMLPQLADAIDGLLGGQVRMCAESELADAARKLAGKLQAAVVTAPRGPASP